MKTKQKDPLGRHDVFRDVKGWDEQTARQWATALDLRAGAEDQIALRSVLIAMAGVKQNQTVAEIGCGTGALLIDLAKAVGPNGHVIGIEPQPVLADSARQKIKEQGLVQLITVNTGSAEELALHDKSVSACFAQTVLIHLPFEARIQALREMHRITEAGGIIVSADQDGDTWIINHPERELTRRIIQFNSDQRYADGWTGRHLESMFRAEGLINVSSKALVHIDRSPGSYLYGMARRIALAAKEAGVINQEEYLLFLAGLDDTAESGEFFSSINYYCCAGKVKTGQ